MDEAKALQIAESILTKAGLTTELNYDNFLDYARTVSDVVKSYSGSQRDRKPWLMEWAKCWRKLYDNFDRLVEADPMILYKPANDVAHDFHASQAFVRYFRAGNRTSKTQSGYAEHYFLATNTHRWRTTPVGAHSSFIVGVNFSKYCPAVFEAKFLVGEEGNYLSPMFPKGGKWFNHYDDKKHVIKLACSPCADAGKAGTCKHRKSTIRLFSDMEGWEVLQGAVYYLGHFDEHIDEDFFNEGIQRTQTAGIGSGLIVTGTPLHGHEAWEHQRLTTVHLDGPPKNRIRPADPDSPPFVSLHEIDQFRAGLVPPDRIRMAMAIMDEFEIESRIYGRPAPLAKNPVFDRHRLAEMRKICIKPKRGDLDSTDGLEAHELTDETKFLFTERSDGAYRVWEDPIPGNFYLIAVDTAKGLAHGDASCASVLHVTSKGVRPYLDLVAQYHAQINPLDYAEEILKLAIHYNSALVVIELTGGYGEATMLRLRKDFFYWNIFRDEGKSSNPSIKFDYRYGVETTGSSKPFMVAALQQFVRDGSINIPCEATISEMVAFEQERSKTGLNVRYRGVGGAHDDRVMSLVIGAATAISSQVLNSAIFFSMDKEAKKPVDKIYEGEWKKIHEELGESGKPLDL